MSVDTLDSWRARAEQLETEVRYYRETMGGTLVDLMAKCEKARDEMIAARDQLMLAALLNLMTSHGATPDR